MATVIATGDDGSEHTASMLGTGVGPIAISPSPLTFGTVPVGSASAAMTLTVCNYAPTAATDAHVTLKGAAAADFVMVLDQVSNNGIHPNGACDQVLSLRLDVPKTETATSLGATLTVSATVADVIESASSALVGAATAGGLDAGAIP
jgi:hypothetical protein